MVCSVREYFGPVKDYECHCGNTRELDIKESFVIVVVLKLLRKKYVESGWDILSLVVPVAHIWYFKSLPNKIGYFIGLPSKKLEMIVYYETLCVIQSGIKEAEE